MNEKRHFPLQCFHFTLLHYYIRCNALCINRLYGFLGLLQRYYMGTTNRCMWLKINALWAKMWGYYIVMRWISMQYILMANPRSRFYAEEHCIEAEEHCEKNIVYPYIFFCTDLSRIIWLGVLVARYLVVQGTMESKFLSHITKLCNMLTGC